MSAEAQEALNLTVLPNQVAPTRRVWAEGASRVAAGLLGAKRLPEIKYFKPSAATGELFGAAVVDSDSINVACDLDLKLMAVAVGHECGHALGIDDEAKAYPFGEQVAKEWLARRSRALPLLIKREKELRAEFISMPSNTKRAEWLCLSLSVSRDVKSFERLVIEELDLRDAEIELLKRYAADSPSSYLQIPQPAPVAPIYSFCRNPQGTQ